MTGLLQPALPETVSTGSLSEEIKCCVPLLGPGLSSPSRRDREIFTLDNRPNGDWACLVYGCRSAVIAAQAPFTALVRMRVELLYIKSSFLSKTATLFPCTKGVVGFMGS